jgi:predicted membrane channel-forming protein YqfA (hemolysin III family)
MGMHTRHVEGVPNVGFTLLDAKTMLFCCSYLSAHKVIASGSVVMDEKQLSQLENRLNQIESRLKTIQNCVYVLIGWIVVMSTPFGISLYQLLGDVLTIVVGLVVVVFAFIWGVKWYQDWKLGKEKPSEG